MYDSDLMKVTYASHHKWTRRILDDLLTPFGKNNTYRLRTTLKNIGDSTITHEFAPLTDETLEWFQPLYQKTISSKNNPKLFDIRSTTIGKVSKYKYYSLTLFEENNPVGATIFSERNSVLSIAYRIYPNSWTKSNLQANPALYAEYLVNEYGLNGGFKTLSHGRDRNPYGINSHIGLAIFKLSLGCTAQLPKAEYEIKTLDLDDINQDILILKYPTEGEQITEAILYVSEENLPKYIQITKYPERLSVETIIREPK